VIPKRSTRVKRNKMRNLCLRKRHMTNRDVKQEKDPQIVSEVLNKVQEKKCEEKMTDKGNLEVKGKILNLELFEKQEREKTTKGTSDLGRDEPQQQRRTMKRKRLSNQLSYLDHTTNSSEIRSRKRQKTLNFSRRFTWTFKLSYTKKKTRKNKSKNQFLHK